jgi:N-acetylglucosamine-6-phosphate deacetylase
VIITAPRVIPAQPGSGILEPGFVRIADGVITEVGQGPPPGRPDLVLASGVLVPGLVDLQVNGYFGVELMAADPAGWAAVAAGLPATGCTAFLPTFVTAPVPRLADALRRAAGFAGRLPPGGARALGVHLEGPFISPARRGAHNPDWIIPASPADVGELLAAGDGLLRLVTLAPEVAGGMAAIGQLTAAGVLVSVGHSDATAAQVAAAAGAGARMVTHLYDAQRPLHHREPGVVGPALADPRLTSGLIADLHHVSAVACAVAFAAAPGRICLVTDAAACAGQPPGRYLLGGEPIMLPRGYGEPPHRVDGTLAGSALRMDLALANMVAAISSLAMPPGPDEPDAGLGPGWAEVPGLEDSRLAEQPALPAVVAAATRVPADLIGRPELGRLAPGAAADLVWLDDDLRTAATWIEGEKVYP